MSKNAHKVSNKSRTLVLERWGLWNYKKLKGKAERSLKCWPAGLVQSRKKSVSASMTDFPNSPSRYSSL